ncbi:AAA family ATPase [Mycolicibacterium boenickei]|uniref:AAA family ATPase n=1 Tax=Mycolicibacterium boenickei TaxID=146017 RepID=A0AAX3A5V1_9MYCO|nr:AAA family ATPase [Mycolicibacterium boenickei]PEG59532.1 hypothetical protein CQY21_16920 [Mycolicibacterium boenickei]UNC02674.1 AAA family ATPase [Mycolicibacterium boenickei]BBX92715.1 hypothetical protein MBOE_43640 [Mycolicibacterium boenickei]
MKTTAQPGIDTRSEANDQSTDENPFGNSRAGGFTMPAEVIGGAYAAELCDELTSTERKCIARLDVVKVADLAALGLIGADRRPTEDDVRTWCESRGRTWTPPTKAASRTELQVAVAGIDPKARHALADVVAADEDGQEWARPVVKHARSLNKIARRERTPNRSKKPAVFSAADLLDLGVPMSTIAALPVATTAAHGRSVDIIDTWDAEDRAQANARARAADGTDPDDGTPLYADIGQLLDDGVPDLPNPDILRRTDDVGLFYRGEINLLYGDPEDGKTMVALAGCAETLRDGGTALFVDLDDNGVESIVARLLMLGAPQGALRARRFRYCSPAGPDRLEQVIRDCTAGTEAPDIAVIDCVGELVPLFDGSNNDSDDFTRIIRGTAGLLARAGTCVILIDHMAKNSDSRNYGSGGTMAKRRRVGGTQIRVSVEVPLRKGQGGTLRLSIRKDRHSGLRQHCYPVPEGKGALQVAGRFIIDPGDAAWCVAIDPMVLTAAEGGTAHDARRSRYIEAARGLADGWTVNELAQRVHGENPTDAQRKATGRVLKSLMTDPNPCVEKLTEGAKFRPATHRLLSD